MTWLSPTDIQDRFRVKRTTAFNLMKNYKANGGEYIKIGKLTRVNAEQFEQYLKGASKK